MQILNIAGYKFISLESLDSLHLFLRSLCQQYELKGTIILSPEGMNVNLAGMSSEVLSFIASLRLDERFADMTFHETYSSTIPFKRLKIKSKQEIITFRQKTIRPTEKKRAPSISPQVLKKWLDEKREITLLDTRNTYEIEFGTFQAATHLNLDHFVQFPSAANGIVKEKPIVMFCTGGIRCEKAALCLLEQGFPEVYQLDGGILNYFAQVGGTHYQGGCFVFDERGTLQAE